ncbi:RES family NAD+ phosphorylase [Falsigemmobacter faecalis]|uniref:RES family NAD+ phosphorylase n=1 Tax=Falsigemmobacter faecalis TaxID=2488730 RepID=UPI0013158E18|nr:RES family NAD+ phosphorylase [Falsigemmobacter faecalis]
MPATEPFIPFSARLWRALPKGADPLSPAPSPEGRFHHSGQQAIYLSPSPQAAGRATARKAGGADLHLQSYLVRLHRLADLRHADVCQALGLTGSEASRPWRSERIAGRPASSWRASDAARAAGCDGLIWTVRNAPHLWHLVVFTSEDERLTLISTEPP